MRRLGLVVALCLVAGTAHAQSHGPQTVQDLLQDCEASLGTTGGFGNLTFCQGYIFGAAAMLTGVGYIAEGSPPGPTQRSIASVGMCVGKVTLGAEVQAFKNWARAHPAKWSDNMDIGVMESLSMTWPCKVK